MAGRWIDGSGACNEDTALVCCVEEKGEALSLLYGIWIMPKEHWVVRLSFSDNVRRAMVWEELEIELLLLCTKRSLLR